jgi:hypothetical protein
VTLPPTPGPEEALLAAIAIHQARCQCARVVCERCRAGHAVTDGWHVGEDALPAEACPAAAIWDLIEKGGE